MRLSLACARPEPDFEFAPADESRRKLRQAMAEPKIAAIEPILKPPLRRRAVLPAQWRLQHLLGRGESWLRGCLVQCEHQLGRGQKSKLGLRLCPCQT